MPGVGQGAKEGIESAFKRGVEKGGVLSEIRKREFYEKPSQKGQFALKNAL